MLLLRLPVPGEELFDLSGGMLGDAFEDVDEPGLGIDVIALGGADEDIHDGCPFAAALEAREQQRFFSRSLTFQGPLGCNVREMDSAVFEKAGEAIPASQHIVHRLGDGGMPGELGA